MSPQPATIVFSSPWRQLSLSKPQQTTGQILHLLDKVPLPTITPSLQSQQDKLSLLSNLSHWKPTGYKTMNYHSHAKTQYGQNIAAKCSYLPKNETQVISRVFFPLVHKTKMPAAWSLVEVRRPLKSLNFQDALDYITYSTTFPPPQSTKQLQFPLWSPLTLGTPAGRQGHQELWIQLIFGINGTSLIYDLQLQNAHVHKCVLQTKPSFHS